MIRQHDAARADADRRGAAGDVRDHDRRRRARDAGHVVMLGEPEAAIAPALGVLREVERVPERLRGGAAFDDRREVEDGERNHPATEYELRDRRYGLRVIRRLMSQFAGNSTFSGGTFPM